MKPNWISSKEFCDLMPINLFGKELEQRAEGDTLHRNKHILFKKTFDVQKSGKYIINISADDYYKLYINGHFVGMGPAFSYNFAYNYNTFDITELIKMSDNEIFVHTYYQGLCNRATNSGDLRAGLWAEILCDDASIIVTDTSWQCAYDKRFEDGEIVGYETQFMENINMTAPSPVWENACINKFANYTMQKQISKTTEITEVFPAKVTAFDNNHFLFDFEKEIAGCLKLKPCDSGKIRILYAEDLDEACHARYQMRCNVNYEEFWTLDGISEIEGYDYKAFRYIEIIGLENPQAVSVLKREYPITKEYKFRSENETLNKIWDICRQACLTASQEGFLDCPTREKGQYLGDLTITAQAHSYITGDCSMYKKALFDFAASAKICSGLMACAPGNLMQEIADFSLLYPYLLLKYHKISKDLDTVKQLLPIVDNLITYFRKYQRKDGLLENVTDKWNLVDWPENLRDDYDFVLERPGKQGCHNVINAYFYGALKVTEKLHSIFGENVNLGCEDFKAAFYREFYDSDRKLFKDTKASTHTSLHSNALPLFYKMVDDDEKIVQLISDKGLCCGVFFSYFVLKGLVKYNHKDLCMSLLLNEGEHSWVNMLREGATTCFEAWGKDQKWNTSLCHPWASSPIIILKEDFPEINIS